MSARGVSERTAVTTTVEVRCTGRVRDVVGTHELEFFFEGRQLRDFLEAFVAEYTMEDMLSIDTERELATTARVWARPPGELPGWRPDGEGQSRPYGRICINGRFSDNLDGLETRLEDGDRIALLYPFLFAPRS
ncbi:pterin cluster protein [Natronorubrum sp. JWXQ-INN-674]|uniref:Pterin cluster protein n=1 Tax=Natronorubrum halalkaliphilum TaxID=2691917 RepID=A0A6B0VRX5_9EURY|nr:MoaD/ThiS family protein [Natronorubrum halalkaliphilum]MXV64288.1 pterin cluster protein [Natronorubrum halalkaliphilum]